MLYLDNAATTPVNPAVLEAMAPWLTREFGNPSSHHTVGERAAATLADARARIARVLGMRARDIVFTAGGTEANNLAVKGIALGAAPRGGRIITTALEHESLLASADYLARLHDYETVLLPVDADGRIESGALVDALRPGAALVSIGYANNEIGTVQDVQELSVLTRAARVPLHIDAVQAAGWLDLSAADGHPLAGVDAISIAGHKIGAPAGTGLLAVRGRVPLEPLVHGGGQESGRRSGTESVAGAVALATALEIAERERIAASARVLEERDAFIEAVLTRVPRARLTGHPRMRLPGHASFTFEGVSGEAVLLELERRGVVSSSGSACAAGSDEPSHVLLALGVAPEIAQTSVRFTLSPRHAVDLLPVAEAVAQAVDAVTG